LITRLAFNNQPGLGGAHRAIAACTTAPLLAEKCDDTALPPTTSITGKKTAAQKLPIHTAAWISKIRGTVGALSADELRMNLRCHRDVQNVRKLPQSLKIMKFPLAFVFATLAVAQYIELRAETIISMPPTNDLACIVIFSGQGYRVGWAQTNAYSDVRVSARLGSGGGIGQTGRAYLTTQIGPGTSVANEVASTNFKFPLQGSEVTLFQGINLAAGSYYLSIIGDSSTWGSCWLKGIPLDDRGIPVDGTNFVIAAADVSFLGTFGAAGGITSSYYPASPTFPDSSIPPEFSVTGTPLPSMSCPVPLVLECTNGSAVGTISVQIQDSSGNPLELVWKVDGTPVQTNNIPAGGASAPTDFALVSRFGLGQHSVAVSLSSSQTVLVTCETSVTVRDTTPPQILATSATPNVLRPPNHRMVPITVKVNASDNCDPSPTFRITAVASNQSLNPSAQDWEITGPNTLNLRAERSANTGDRIYTISVDCTDSAGNTKSDTVLVTVPQSN